MMYQLSGQYQAIATIMLNIYQLSRQRLLLCWICNSCQDSSCYSAEYVPLPAVKTAAAISTAQDVPAVNTAADMLLNMYKLSRQQRLFCSRCTICQDSSWYDAEDVLAVKTASAILLKMYQLSRPQLICCWRCTSWQGSSCYPSRRCTSWHAPAFFVKLKLNPWVARCTLSLSKCTLVLPPTPLLRGIGYRYI